MSSVRILLTALLFLTLLSPPPALRAQAVKSGSSGPGAAVPGEKAAPGKAAGGLSDESVRIASSVEFSSAEWNFGEIPPDGRLSKELELTNVGPREFAVTLMSTCDCIVVTAPVSRKLKPGEKTAFVVTLDPSGETGPVEWNLIVRTSLPELPKAFYRIEGTVAAGTVTDGKKPPAPSGASLKK